MARPKLGSAAIKAIHAVVDTLFDRLKLHVLGDKYPTGKKLYFTYRPDLTLKGIFDTAAEQEGVVPQEDTAKALLNIAANYIDASREKTKAKVVQGLQSFIHDAANKGLEVDVKTSLDGKLAEIMGEVKRDVQRIVETESTIVRNTSIMEGIVKVNEAAGIDDPTVFFVTVRDQHRCTECTRLHMLGDGVTPRCWKMSELGSGYHHVGDSSPKIGGLHPHCRCVLTTLLPGFGFTSGGMVEYKSPGWDELEHQRSK